MLGKKLFINPETGHYYMKGETFKQPDLQKFLETMASEGVSEMYTGTWARDMVALVEKENGFITLDDLRNYKANWKNSLNTTYRGYTAVSSGKTLPFLGQSSTEGKRGVKYLFFKVHMTRKLSLSYLNELLQ